MRTVELQTPWNWPAGTVRPVPVVALGERYRRYRLTDEEAERAMVNSLRRYGQQAPIVVWLREETPEVVDGFKRLAAARRLPLPSLSARLLDADERRAKAAIYGLNQIGQRTCELEEAWIVHALVREDGLSQVAAAELLGRHKSWVCRRLALLEKLGPEAKEDLRVGLLAPTAARALTALPAGNQAEVLSAARQHGLSTAELRGVVELLRSAASRAQVEYVLAKPREALQQAQGLPGRSWDPRLSPNGNRIARQLDLALAVLGRLENWLRQRGRADLSRQDQEVLTPSFVRLGRDSQTVSELTNDLVEDWHA